LQKDAAANSGADSLKKDPEYCVKNSTRLAQWGFERPRREGVLDGKHELSASRVKTVAFVTLSNVTACGHF
jgi:hypothetical protein